MENIIISLTTAGLTFIATMFANYLNFKKIEKNSDKRINEIKALVEAESKLKINEAQLDITKDIMSSKPMQDAMSKMMLQQLKKNNR